jgi:hypothetical protein
VTPLVEVAGKDGTVPFVHIVSELPKLNDGVITGFTVTAREVITAHWPASGVNV